MSSAVDIKTLLTDMLAIPAMSRVEGMRADFLQAYLEGLGLQPERIGNNLLLGDPLAEKPVILLNSHIDTVKPAEGWETDPFKPLLEGNRITGLGSNDAGASVVSLISVYQQWMQKKNHKFELLLLLSSEEEISGKGGLSMVLPRLDKVKAAIVGEPTGMCAAVAERGLMVVDAAAVGKAGHAARNEGENAIYKAMQDLEAIQNMSFPDESSWLPAPSAQVTLIEAGTGHNAVPDLCKYVIDVRSNDLYPNERLFAMLVELCGASLEARSMRLRSSGLDPKHLLMKAALELDLKPFGSATLSDMALMRFPALKMGPGDSARSHTAGEYILLSEIEEGIAIYLKLLEKLETYETLG